MHYLMIYHGIPITLSKAFLFKRVFNVFEYFCLHVCLSVCMPDSQRGRKSVLNPLELGLQHLEAVLGAGLEPGSSGRTPSALEDPSFQSPLAPFQKNNFLKDFLTTVR